MLFVNGVGLLFYLIRFSVKTTMKQSPGFRCTLCVAILLLLIGCTPVGHDVSMLSAVWEPHSDPLTVIDNLEVLTNEEELLFQNAENLGGEINIFSYRSTGRGTGSRMILVLQKPVDEPVRLAIPKGESVIYIQEDDGWRSIPSSFPTLDDIHILVETIKEGELYTTEAKIILPRGGTELIGGVGWPPEP